MRPVRLPREQARIPKASLRATGAKTARSGRRTGSKREPRALRLCSDMRAVHAESLPTAGGRSTWMWSILAAFKSWSVFRAPTPKRSCKVHERARRRRPRRLLRRPQAAPTHSQCYCSRRSPARLRHRQDGPNEDRRSLRVRAAPPSEVIEADGKGAERASSFGAEALSMAACGRAESGRNGYPR